VSAADTLKRVPPAYWLLRRARMTAGDLLPARTIPGIDGPVHRNDVMLASGTGPEEYQATGRAAARFVADAIEAAGVTPSYGLDLGSGHGRVLRHLVDLVPAAWTACDIDRSAVRFCGRAFGATPVRARRPLGATPFPATAYDVVWMGSLVTHLSPEAALGLWTTLLATTARPAVVALSLLPPPMVVHLESFGPGMGRHRDAVVGALADDGMAYVPYPHHPRGGYGVTFHDPDRLLPSLRALTGATVELVAHAPGAWQGMQDYLALRIVR
jgi:SAM-dependent methyltransferase